MNDNRNYKYSIDSRSKRSEFGQILKWVKKGSSVIDLGCGDGTLLDLLKKDKLIKKADGIEITRSGVTASKKKNINVWQGRIDTPLIGIKDKTYDYAICNVTLQMVLYPEVLMKEMGRISKRQIVSFPNFAFFPNRLEMLFRGRMPKLMLFGYEWYSTGHIHQLSIKDFEKFCKDNNFKTLDVYYFIPRVFKLPQGILKLFPNFFSITSIYLLGQQ